MTTRSRHDPPLRLPLTPLENEVMRAVWDAGKASVEAVHEVVGHKRGIKENTTRTLLQRLEQKGYLMHEESGRAYIYKAAEPARSFAARAVRQIIDAFCRGSVEELVSGMVETRALSAKEIQQIRRAIARKKRD
jgi:predicted transcriptional regulator